MLETFYNVLQQSQTWFFGNLLADPFVSLIVNAFNAFVLISMFYAVLYYPIRWIVSKFLHFLNKV